MSKNVMKRMVLGKAVLDELESFIWSEDVQTV